MKRFMTWLVLLLGLMGCSGAALAHDMGLVSAIVDGKTADRVHLREHPSAQATSLGLYFTGTAVLCETSVQQAWAWVQIGSEAGYMKTEFLYLGHDPAHVTPKQPQATVYNSKGSDWVNLRSAPSLDALILDTCANGTIITVLGETATHWYYIKAGEQYGYMASDYVQMGAAVAPAAPARPTAAPGIHGANISVTYYPLYRKYETKAGNYLELDLLLPRLAGSHAGIPVINDYFAGKEQFFYNGLPFDVAQEAEANGASIAGALSGYYRSAHYALTAVLDNNIVSFAADLNGGAGGVSWAGIEGNTFDLRTGRRLSLDDLFRASKEQYMGVLFDLITREIAGNISASYIPGTGLASPYFFEDAYDAQAYESIHSFNPDDFYLTEDALIVFYQKYALAAGAAGPQVFAIPFDALRDMLALPIR